MSDRTDAFVRKNQARFLSELIEFLRIPSISTLPEHEPDIRRAAKFLAASLREAGIENVEIIPTAGNPLVYGEWLHAPGKPTVLCYGHYDVQPVDPLDQWATPPFEPTQRDGNLYARGSADDKGQMYMHIKAVEALRAANGTLPVNLKFLIEGEEEVGGASITKYVASNPEKLRADVALISDTAMYADGMPTLTIGLRDSAPAVLATFLLAPVFAVTLGFPPAVVIASIGIPAITILRRVTAPSLSDVSPTDRSRVLLNRLIFDRNERYAR